MPDKRCLDIVHDRKMGGQWEKNFCNMLICEYGRLVTPHQLKKEGAAIACRMNGKTIHRMLLPDITVWNAPGQHHEIKHKNKTKPRRDGYRCYGLEEYRLDALIEFGQITEQPIYYTIHDWELAGAENSKENTENRLADWLTINISELVELDFDSEWGPSWVNGEKRIVKILYWPGVIFHELEGLLT